MFDLEYTPELTCASLYPIHDTTYFRRMQLNFVFRYDGRNYLRMIDFRFYNFQAEKIWGLGLVASPYEVASRKNAFARYGIKWGASCLSPRHSNLSLQLMCAAFMGSGSDFVVVANKADNDVTKKLNEVAALMERTAGVDAHEMALALEALMFKEAISIPPEQLATMSLKYEKTPDPTEHINTVPKWKENNFRNRGGRGNWSKMQRKGRQ